MDLSLTDEQRLIAATVHDFVERELYPHEDEVERLDEVPGEVARAIRKKAIAAGLYAANMPAELGGGGLDAVSLVLVERELGRASYVLQMLVERPSNILQACQEEQRERYLLPAIRGERHDCVAMTEPEAGSDVRSMTITAVRDGDSYVVTGTKHFISHADVADFIILFAATGQEQTTRGPKKLITALLVDSPSPGLAVRRGPPCVSNRGYHHCELVFSGRRVLEAATQWAASRRQFGQPIGRFQGVGFQLADMATELEAAEMLTLRAAAKLDQGTMTDADAAMAKLYASEMLGRMTDAAVQIFGGMGLMSELPVERWWRDARVERIWDGTSEIQRHIIARSLLRPYGG